jgi:hypothetical protein
VGDRPPALHYSACYIFVDRKLGKKEGPVEPASLIGNFMFNVFFIRKLEFRILKYFSEVLFFLLSADPYLHRYFARIGALKI